MSPKRWRRSARGRGRRSVRGTAILELAVTLPVFVLIIAGTFYFGRRYDAAVQLHIAARYSVWHAANGSGRGDGVSDLRDRFLTGSPGTLRVEHDGCEQSALSRLGGGGASSSACAVDAPGPSTPLGSLGGLIGGFFSDRGIDFSLHARRLELETSESFLSGGSLVERRLVAECWLHDNYAPQADVSDDEVFDGFDVDFTRDPPVSVP